MEKIFYSFSCDWLDSILDIFLFLWYPHLYDWRVLIPSSSAASRKVALFHSGSFLNVSELKGKYGYFQQGDNQIILVVL